MGEYYYYEFRALDRRLTAAAAAAAVAVKPGGYLGDAARQRVLVRELPR
ncbi:MAG: hypothetical protein ACYCO9_01995 [Streptosporangiaceae bacterium]